jgi:DnaK suppressor protein
MWMTREEIAAALGVVPNSVRGKVQKGQIERKIENGKNFYRIIDGDVKRHQRAPVPFQIPSLSAQVQEIKKSPIERSGIFRPKEVLLSQLASIKVGRNIDAIEKGDEIDLATGEISRELEAKISMRQHRQLKEIEDALERLKLGEYGMCEDCGEPIPEQRLRLFPAARLCVRCQEELDHYEKIKDHQGLRGGAWREESSEGGYVKSFED